MDGPLPIGGFVPLAIDGLADYGVVFNGWPSLSRSGQWGSLRLASTTH
jgi:NADH:ubiquinone oxidoreductase subunit H